MLLSLLIDLFQSFKLYLMYKIHEINLIVLKAFYFSISFT
ncbi:hypothetical protein Alsa3_CDS0217 [Staphylococcus phage Alsa_3]|nr:hypothetical protein Alsa3_CDS0217 [Staphylococcus phage Alsa_3]WNM51341.1 hypothetical protein Alsa4_CDS0211 [Staphylococcus phage Alsa_4]